VTAGAPDTLPKLLMQQAAERGGRPALREKRRGIWHTWTWHELAGEVAAIAAALLDSGLQRGAHVAFIGDNRPRLFAAMSAAQWLGAVVLPLFPDAPADEIAGPLRSAAVTHAFAENQEQVDKLLHLLPSCPALRCIVYDKERGMRHYAQPQLAAYASFLKRGKELATTQREALDAERQRGSAGDPACLFFTSGTTGPPKGVVLSHGALIDRARALAAMDGLDENDVSVAYLPPAWINQHLFGHVQPLLLGSCVCCPESPDTMLADMREMGPTLLLATPRVLERLLAQVHVRMQDAGRLQRGLYGHALALARRVGSRLLDGEPAGLGDRLLYTAGNALIYAPLRDVLGMSRLRLAYGAGEAIGADLLAFYRSIGVNLRQLYGSTETGAFVALQRNGPLPAGAVGPAVQGVELRIGERSEILVRSAGLFSRYHGDDAATRQALDGEGWFRTGDAGSVADDGSLRILDRVGDIGALADGTPFTPRPIENRLKFSPYINEAVAFGNGRDGVCVLVDIDGTTVGNWADRRDLSYTGHADLASREEVYGLVADCIAEVNAELAADERLARSQVRRFVILPRELDPDDGVLTRMRKLRREAIAQRHEALIAALYGAPAGGPGGTAAAGLRIGDAPTYPPAPQRAAA
jgi:long-chain acyl-CoA synthetase